MTRTPTTAGPGPPPSSPSTASATRLGRSSRQLQPAQEAEGQAPEPQGARLARRLDVLEVLLRRRQDRRVAEEVRQLLRRHVHQGQSARLQRRGRCRHRRRHLRRLRPRLGVARSAGRPPRQPLVHGRQGQQHGADSGVPQAARRARRRPHCSPPSPRPTRRRSTPAGTSRRSSGTWTSPTSRATTSTARAATTPGSRTAPGDQANLYKDANDPYPTDFSVDDAGEAVHRRRRQPPQADHRHPVLRPRLAAGRRRRQRTASGSRPTAPRRASSRRRPGTRGYNNLVADLPGPDRLPRRAVRRTYCYTGANGQWWSFDDAWSIGKKTGVHQVQGPAGRHDLGDVR